MKFPALYTEVGESQIYIHNQDIIRYVLPLPHELLLGLKWLSTVILDFKDYKQQRYTLHGRIHTPTFGLHHIRPYIFSPWPRPLSAMWIETDRRGACSHGHKKSNRSPLYYRMVCFRKGWKELKRKSFRSCCFHLTGGLLLLLNMLKDLIKTLMGKRE